jgi:hypothetical protein
MTGGRSFAAFSPCRAPFADVIAVRQRHVISIKRVLLVAERDFSMALVGLAPHHLWDVI